MKDVKTLRVLVELEIRADENDETDVRDNIKEALAEALEYDAFEYTVEEMEE